LVAVFPGFDNPNIPHLGSMQLIAVFLLLLLDEVLPSLVVIYEFIILWVLHAFLDVEGQGDVVVDVVSHK
jgi:hypothetical protein